MHQPDTASRPAPSSETEAARVTRPSPATRCACGKRISKYAKQCRACHEARMAKLHEAAAVVVASGRCPACGSGLRRNLALTGWWTCEQKGAVGFRKDATRPACDFQTFTA